MMIAEININPKVKLKIKKKDKIVMAVYYLTD